MENRLCRVKKGSVKLFYLVTQFLRAPNQISLSVLMVRLDEITRETFYISKGPKKGPVSKLERLTDKGIKKCKCYLQITYKASSLQELYCTIVDHCFSSLHAEFFQHVCIYF